MPQEKVSEALSEAGVSLHFAGHMNINDTGIRKFKNNNTLVNVQIPSLAAYRPGYKVLEVDDGIFTVKTRFLKDVPRFDELFPLYEKEYQYLLKNNIAAWNHDILKTKNYHDFMLFYLKELVRLRFIPTEWPADFIEEAENLSAGSLLKISRGIGTDKEFEDYVKMNKIHLKSFEGWRFKDLIFDLYQYQSADSAAKKDIPKSRRMPVKFLKIISKN